MILKDHLPSIPNFNKEFLEEAKSFFDSVVSSKQGRISKKLYGKSLATPWLTNKYVSHL
jgi:hypothetical protein